MGIDSNWNNEIKNMMCFKCDKEAVKGADIDNNFYCLSCWAPLIAEKIVDLLMTTSGESYDAHVVISDDKK